MARVAKGEDISNSGLELIFVEGIGSPMRIREGGGGAVH
jgi:hypothetical protein